MMDRGEISATPEDEGRGSRVDVPVADGAGLAGRADGKKDGGGKDAEEADDFFEDE